MIEATVNHIAAADTMSASRAVSDILHMRKTNKLVHVHNDARVPTHFFQNYRFNVIPEFQRFPLEYFYNLICT